MTAALIVSSHGKQVAKAIIEKDYFVMGRSKRADVVLDDTNISREHATILLKSGSYHLQDRGSRNGTLLNGSPVTAQEELHEGDSITIGPFEIKFMESDSSNASYEDDGEKTSFMEPAKRKGGKKKKKGRRSANLNFKLTATDGPLRGTSYTNWEGDLVFGRAASSQVVLPEDAVSQSHARIWEEDGLFFLEDMGSSNGTFVQGVRVQNTRLKNKQRVRIGGSTFMFTVEDPEKKKFLLAVVSLCMVFLLILCVLGAMLQTDDPFEALVADGRAKIKRGEYSEAKSTFEKVLEFRADSPEAKKGIATANKGIEREQTLMEAKTLAENEQYDASLDIIYKILRQYPKYQKAKDLEQVINTVKDAQIAFGAKNWPDAIRYLKKARQGYPKSTLLSRMLERAQAEQASQNNLTKAKEFVAHGQADSAQEFLLGIPSDSAYYIEARGILKSLRSADVVAGLTSEARSKYRLGNYRQALSIIEQGLQQNPDDKSLEKLKVHIKKVAPLADRIAAGRSLAESDDVPAINEMLEICSALTDIEPDNESYYRTAADDLSSALEIRLSEIEREALAKGERYLSEGNRIEAYKFFVAALKANPNDERAAKVVAEIKAEVAAECKKFYQQGLVHEELAQIDMAITAYEKVIAIGLEDDAYYQRASRKLDRLRR